MSDLKREEGSGAVVSGCLAGSVRFDTSLIMLIRNYYHFPLSFFLSFFLSRNHVLMSHVLEKQACLQGYVYSRKGERFLHLDSQRRRQGIKTSGFLFD